MFMNINEYIVGNVCRHIDFKENRNNLESISYISFTVWMGFGRIHERS